MTAEIIVTHDRVSVIIVFVDIKAILRPLNITTPHDNNGWEKNVGTIFVGVIRRSAYTYESYNASIGFVRFNITLFCHTFDGRTDLLYAFDRANLIL